MPAARVPDTDPSRLAALHALQILDTEREAAFDHHTWLASAMLGTPIAAISLLDSDRQWFKSTVGLTAQETPRDQAFCGYTILGTEPLVIKDALADARFSDNDMVTGGPRIRFYAGVPLRTADGHNIGALCAIDTRPRVLTRSQIAVLETLAETVVRAIEKRGAAHQAVERARCDGGTLAFEG